MHVHVRIQNPVFIELSLCTCIPRFALAHEGKMCRRSVFLEYLGENPSTVTAENGCCNVCSNVCEVADYQKEVSAIVRVVQEIPNYGERKVPLSIIHFYVGYRIHTLPMASFSRYIAVHKTSLLNIAFLSSQSGSVDQEVTLSRRFSRQLLTPQLMESELTST